MRPDAAIAAQHYETSLANEKVLENERDIAKQNLAKAEDALNKNAENIHAYSLVLAKTVNKQVPVRIFLLSEHRQLVVTYRPDLEMEGRVAIHIVTPEKP